MRRRVAIIVLLLIGGTVVNVAVAWGLHATMDLQMPDATEATGSGAGGWSGIEGADYFAWIVFKRTSPHASRTMSRWQDQGTGGGLFGGWPDDPAEPLIPRWASQLSPENRIPCGVHHYSIAWEYGWPMRSVGGSAHAQSQIISGAWSAQVEYHFAVALEPALLQDPNDHWDVRLFVLRPLWPGFAINTLFYAALIWLIFVAPFAARRMIRRRRGLCARCAYPIGTSPVCTECGAAVDPASQTESPPRSP